MRARYPLTTISGLLTTVICLSLGLVAYLDYPTTISPSANWLSDLGNRILSPQGAVDYRTAAVATGVMLAVFFVALGASFRRQGGYWLEWVVVSVLLLFVGAVALTIRRPEHPSADGQR